jgi:hypothetical protein
MRWRTNATSVIEAERLGLVNDRARPDWRPRGTAVRRRDLNCTETSLGFMG